MLSLASIALTLGKWLLGFAEKKADAAVEKARIQAGVDISVVEGKVEVSRAAAAVVQSGMQFKVFWLPWLAAALPLSAWFGWGVIDSIANGALPDVATLPPQIKEYADIVWGNIFYVGGGVAGAQLFARAIERRR